MPTDDVHAAALALGRALCTSPAVAAYRFAEAAFEADPAAQRALTALNTAQADYLQAERVGLTPSQQQVEQLRRSQSMVRASEVLMSHLRATNTVKRYLPTVAAEVTAALGADYSSLIAPVGDC